MNSINEKESLVLKLIEEKKTEEAINILYELICAAVDVKDFIKADKYRDRIYQIDSMAISVIIKTNNLIEKAKTEAVDKRHTALWDKIYSKLSKEETNALFYALEKKKIEPDKNIVKQGDLNPYLFFIESGEIRVFYTVKDKNIFVQNLRSGSIAGKDSFFSATVSTISLSTISDTQVNCLHKNYITKWKNELPLLESKLKDFCLNLDIISGRFNGKKMNRRMDERFPVTGAINFRVLKSDGELMEGNFRGALSDISAGGLSFVIKSGSKEIANRLLGRNIKVNSKVKISGDEIILDQVGIVNAVEFMPLISLSSNDYIVHIKTDEKIQLT